MEEAGRERKAEYGSWQNYMMTLAQRDEPVVYPKKEESIELNLVQPSGGEGHFLTHPRVVEAVVPDSHKAPSATTLLEGVRKDAPYVIDGSSSSESSPESSAESSSESESSSETSSESSSESSDEESEDDQEGEEELPPLIRISDEGALPQIIREPELVKGSWAEEMFAKSYWLRPIDFKSFGPSWRRIGTTSHKMMSPWRQR
jgi:hypothetical protein